MVNYPKEGDIEIDGFCFYGEIQPDVSFSYHEMKTTKILHGTEVNTLGDYVPREFTVKSYIWLGSDNKRLYDKKFMEMMSKPCRVFCEDMGDSFYANIIIKKTPVTGAPGSYNLEIKVKEIPEINDYYIDNFQSKPRRKIVNKSVTVTKNKDYKDTSKSSKVNASNTSDKNSKK